MPKAVYFNLFAKQFSHVAQLDHRGVPRVSVEEFIAVLYLAFAEQLCYDHQLAALVDVGSTKIQEGTRRWCGRYVLSLNDHHVIHTCGVQQYWDVVIPLAGIS